MESGLLWAVCKVGVSQGPDVLPEAAIAYRE